jgi:hypothetical protein
MPLYLALWIVAGHMSGIDADAQSENTKAHHQQATAN